MTTIPDHIAYYEIKGYLKGKIPKLTDQGYLPVREPLSLTTIGKRYKKDSRASAKLSRRSAEPKATTGKKR